MPITPFHFGPGAVVKAVASRYFSFTVFAFSQGLIDLEPIGFFSIDSIMHGDMEPFAPFSDASPWLHAVQLETLHFACVAAGIIGVAGLFVIRWLELKEQSSGGT